MVLGTGIKLGILSPDVDHWLGTKSHQQGGSLLFRVQVRNSQGDLDIETWMSDQCSRNPTTSQSELSCGDLPWLSLQLGSDDITGTYGGGISLGTKARAGSVLKCSSSLQGASAKGNLLPRRGWRKGTHPFLCVPGSSLHPFFFQSEDPDRFGVK